MMKRKRENEKKEVRKGCNECALCTISGDEKNGKNERVCNIFLAVLNGRAYQTRFKSEQSIPAALGMLLYFMHFCAYYTHKYNKQMDGLCGIGSEELLASKGSLPLPTSTPTTKL